MCNCENNLEEKRFQYKSHERWYPYKECNIPDVVRIYCRECKKEREINE